MQVGQGRPAWIFSIGPLRNAKATIALASSRELPTISVHDRGVYQKLSNWVLNERMDFQMRASSLEPSLGGSPAGLTVTVVVSPSWPPTSSRRAKMKRYLVTCRWNVPCAPSRSEIAANQRKRSCGVPAAKQGEELHIDHNRPGKCRSCGFRTVCGENLV